MRPGHHCGGGGTGRGVRGRRTTSANSSSSSPSRPRSAGRHSLSARSLPPLCELARLSDSRVHVGAVATGRRPRCRRPTGWTGSGVLLGSILSYPIIVTEPHPITVTTLIVVGLLVVAAFWASRRVAGCPPAPALPPD